MYNASPAFSVGLFLYLQAIHPTVFVSLYEDESRDPQRVVKAPRRPFRDQSVPSLQSES